jgi:hypothetical protein
METDDFGRVAISATFFSAEEAVHYYCVVGASERFATCLTASRLLCPNGRQPNASHYLPRLQIVFVCRIHRNTVSSLCTMSEDSKIRDAWLENAV